MAEGQRIHYDFIKPHASLEGRTPAKAAKIDMKKLAEDSTSGMWVAEANFAIIVLTNPKHNFHMIDAGRVLQNMQLAAWNRGVASGLFTGVKEEKLRNDFAIPKELNITLTVGFGYPARKLTGKKKDRMPMGELVYSEKYGNPITT